MAGAGLLMREKRGDNQRTRVPEKVRGTPEHKWQEGLLRGKGAQPLGVRRGQRDEGRYRRPPGWGQD